MKPSTLRIDASSARGPARRAVAALSAVVLGGFALAAHAQSTPAGLWKTVDDETQREKSLVRIVEAGGVYSGTLEKLLDPAVPADAVCEKCHDERKGKPLIGLPLIRHLGHHEAGSAVWSGGEILDPKNGKTYKLRLTLVDGGKQLEVRGYIGMPLIGRTQTWTRVE